MDRILVIYGTTHGQAAKVAQAIGGELGQVGMHAEVAEASDLAPAPDAYDGVIVIGSVHAGGYQRNLRRWVRTHVEALARRPAAFVSVCLGVLQHNDAVDRELSAIRDRFYAATGWQPVVVTVVAGALPYTKYNWFTRWTMRRIVAKAHGDTDTSRDYEYTNWSEVRQFAREFATTVTVNRARAARAQPANSGAA